MTKRGLKKRKVGHGRNDLCECGSGKKYKNCCKPVYRMKTDEELAEEKSIHDERKSASSISRGEFLTFMSYMERIGIGGHVRR